LDTDKKVFIVAEAGNNHEGSFDRAKELVIRAAEAGADAIKFQTFVPESFVSFGNKERLEILRSFQLTYSQFESLAQLASDQQICFFSTPLDIESAYFLNSIQTLFKIASGDNNFWPLIKTVLSFNKPVIVSTGISSLDQVDEVFNFFDRHKKTNLLSFLHCVSSYPAPADQVNLSVIRGLQDRYKEVAIGYSDHTLGTRVAVYAVAVGARIVEKHFTLDKNQSSFRDHQLSADPREMKEMVQEIRALEGLLGSSRKDVQPCETALVTEARRSIAASIDIESGHKVSFKDLAWVRPGSEFKPGSEESVVGRVTRRRVLRGQVFTEDDFVGLTGPAQRG
jgi:N,N'-diacetyllegionaminate synthase